MFLDVIYQNDGRDLGQQGVDVGFVYMCMCHESEG